MPTLTELPKNQKGAIDDHKHGVGSPKDGLLNRVLPDLPQLEGKSFTQWLESVSQNDSIILHIRLSGNNPIIPQIREDFPKIRTVEYQIGPAYTEKGAIVPRDDFLGEGIYDLIIADRIAPHLQDPFLLIAKLYLSLKEKGVLFINGILIDKGVISNVDKIWQEEKNAFSIIKRPTPNSLTKSGFVCVDLAVKKTNDNLTVPMATDNPVTDYQGRVYPTHDYRRNSFMIFAIEPPFEPIDQT